MDKIVNIHYVDKEAFMNVAIVDKYEEVLTFLDSPTYEEVVAETRIRLKWVDPSDQVELLGRYDVGSAQKCRMKTMPIKSNLHWVAYKEAVASSIDKLLEVFASTVVNAPLHVDLNQPIVDDLSPYNSVAPIVEHKVEAQVNEYPQYEFGGSAPIKDDGHESDEEYGGVSTQQGENGVGAEKDAASEEQRLMERAAKKLREQDAAEAKKMERERQYEEFEAKRKEDLKMFLEHCAYEKKMKDKHKKAMEQRHNEWAAKFKIAMAEGAAKREREEELFMERVLEDASKMRKREDEEEEERKKKKGKGPCSTQ
ncbi:hypothetical protein D1007_51872 [Hordeum vulgare]|nr:hypothetical protein D1007_51872 [Hordeum vulgare]